MFISRNGAVSDCFNSQSMLAVISENQCDRLAAGRQVLTVLLNVESFLIYFTPKPYENLRLHLVPLFGYLLIAEITVKTSLLSWGCLSERC